MKNLLRKILSFFKRQPTAMEKVNAFLDERIESAGKATTIEHEMSVLYECSQGFERQFILLKNIINLEKLSLNGLIIYITEKHNKLSELNELDNYNDEIRGKLLALDQTMEFIRTL